MGFNPGSCRIAVLGVFRGNISPLPAVHATCSSGSKEQQDQSMWGSYIALAKYFKVLHLCSWKECKMSVIQPQQSWSAFLHSLLSISESLWRASTWLRVGGKDCKSSVGVREGLELLWSSCMTSKRTWFLQHLSFEWLSLWNSTLHKKLVSGPLSSWRPFWFCFV